MPLRSLGLSAPYRSISTLHGDSGKKMEVWNPVLKGMYIWCLVRQECGRAKKTGIYRDALSSFYIFPSFTLSLFFLSPQK